ncbi:MAG: succinyl-diaminopimelate desuccinylase [Betaproteobacteria bacterium AqS2]|uniref:Succinyl-diaminopimelate desuccinylase n=1 Tax=Candidatus Amphirhobacter heronislandensis TaxID=1732024 RepID=A0A930Y2D6_9GAMM|nr:succinyl-diaminopimelate desuccinylase [Betaproteobacteria bacterium AqS2]
MSATATASAARALALLKELVSCPSLTPESAGTIEIARRELEAAGFKTEEINRGAVRNLYAVHGEGEGLLLLCGHLDVVPPGDAAAWDTDPFEPVEKDGKLYGRGTTDMKGGVAAMLVAATEHAAAAAKPAGRLALLLTTDEEGEAVDGVRHAVEVLKERGEKYRHALVGEPSSAERFGDLLRVGRRGSLTCRIKVEGKQGHAAYPQLCANPVPALAALAAEISGWEFAAPEDGTEATSVQVVRLHADAGAANVIPGTAEATVNFRHHPLDDPAALRARLDAALAAAPLPASCDCAPGAAPYHTGAASEIGRAAAAAIEAACGQPPRPSVGGGTSDGRFLGAVCAEVVEFGSVGRSMHMANEHIEIAQLGQLAAVYRDVIDRIRPPAAG